jgi:hypothetical protein
MVTRMGGRRDDSAPGRSALPPVSPPSRGRSAWLVVGLLLAAGATAAVFFTDDPLYLRVALLAVCWAFVVAAFLAGNRRTDQVAAAAREAELRHAYDLELEREVAARHEYEVELESRLRHEAEDAMRAELTDLRGELTGLSKLREDLAAVTQLRADLAGLGQLRTELAALTEIRGELAGLGQLRAELAGLGELRTDLGRMRTELTEQLSGELLIERMVMRAQSVRGPSQPTADADGRTLEGTTSWDVDRWQETRVVPAEPVELAPRPIAAPPPVPPPAPPRSPLEWLGDRSLLDEGRRPTAAPPVVAEPAAPRRHRRAAPDDEELLAPSYETPAWTTPSPTPPAGAEVPSYGSSAYDEMLFGAVVPEPEPTGSTAWPTGSTSYDSSGYEPALRSEPETAGHARLEQILAESGADAPSGGRSRRRRYRDEDDEPTGDDVLARVLGRG